MVSSFNAYYQGVQSSSHVVLQHLPSIEWLVSTGDQHRRSGRSRALALAFLRDSFETGRPVKLFDHVGPDSSAWSSVSSGGIPSYLAGLGVEMIGADQIGAQPVFGVAPSPGRGYSDSLFRIKQDFSSIVRAAISIGVSPDWMLTVVKNAMAESVMSS